MDGVSIASRLLSETWTILLELAPWLLLGIAIAGLLHVLLPRDLIEKHLRGRGGVLKAVALGVPMPLCSCGVIPTAIGLRRDGASPGASIGFLISTPQTGVDSILVSASFLGWPFALFKVAAAATTGVIGGWLTDAVAPTEHAAESRSDSPTGSSRRTPAQPPERVEHHDLRRRTRAALDHMLGILRTIWLWIAVGVVVSAAIGVLVPERTLAGLGALGPLGGALFALVVSLPLYVCATASVPIAAALVAAGMPTGAALVFLMAGPATNVADFGAVGRNFGRRVLGVYLGTLVIGSLAAALLFDWLIPTAGPRSLGHAHDPGPLATGAAILLLGVLVWLAVQDGLRLLQRHGEARFANEPTVSLAVSGMSCGACVRKLEDALRAIDGAQGVRVELEPGRAEVRGPVEADAVRAAIRAAGFESAS